MPVVAAPPVRPVLSAVRLSPSVFTARRGTTLSLTLSAPARVTVRITHTFRGRRIDGACVERGTRGARCTRTALAAKVTFAAAAGPDSFRLRVPNLSPGRYEAALSALGAGYRRSAGPRLGFRINR